MAQPSSKTKKESEQGGRSTFNQLLNRPSAADQEALQQIPQKPLLEDLDLPPSVDEVKTAIKEMNGGKTPGTDGIHLELYKVICTTDFKAFHDILVSILEEECMPADFRDAIIFTLYKKKGATSDCRNSRGISLLSIAGKILALILLNRLITIVSESNLPEAQCGFRSGRSTIDMMLAVRQVKEKCVEQQMDLYSVFIDLTKAFDTVNRQALWTILAKLGCPCKFIAMVRLFHDNKAGFFSLFLLFCCCCCCCCCCCQQPS